jgi:ArsR family transcriptional regulator
MPRVSNDKLSVKIRAVADPNRRQILRMLAGKGKNSLDKPTGLCASDIEARLKISQPTISHHMRILNEAGLVITKKLGQWMWYRRNETELRALAKQLKAL